MGIGKMNIPLFLSTLPEGMTMTINSIDADTPSGMYTYNQYKISLPHTFTVSYISQLCSSLMAVLIYTSTISYINTHPSPQTSPPAFQTISAAPKSASFSYNQTALSTPATAVLSFSNSPYPGVQPRTLRWLKRT